MIDLNRFYMYYVTHLPVLMRLTRETRGPIVELGAGYCSTIFLHWTCFPSKRKLVTYESDPEFFSHMLSGVLNNRRNIQSDFHEAHLVKNWSDVDLSAPWSIALVDHGNGRERYLSVKRLVHAEYVVVHDTEPRAWRRHRWREVFPLFKYRYDYWDAHPGTTVLSNVDDLAGFSIP